MYKEENNNFLIVLGVFIVASALRIILNKNIYIINIIGAINIIAFWYVFYLILDQTKNFFYKQLNETSFIGEQVKLKKKKYFKRNMNISKSLIFILGLIYMFFLANSIINDIISLGALFLSIQTNCICNYINNYFLKKH